MKNMNSSHYLDRSVVVFFLAAFLISSSILAYRYTTKVPCDRVDLDIKANKFDVGELIRFKDKTIGAESWKWDFGDETFESTSQEALHVYKKPGKYKVRLLVNNSCEKITTLTIHEKKKVLDPTKFPVFNVPKRIAVGEELVVGDETPHAESWEWRFGETAESNSSEQKASYVYTTPGLKTISLIVNGDLTYITKKQIEVVPSPEKEVIADPTWQIEQALIEEPVVMPQISDAEFEQRIMMVSRGEITADAFSDFFCGDLNEQQIVARGKTMSFLVFCEKIKKRRIKKIKSLQISREKKSNCINAVTIDYKRKGIF